MKDLSFSNALRYVLPSMVAFSYLYIYDAALAGKFLETLGVLGIIAFVFLGSVIYLIYRIFIYTGCIIKLQDLCRLATNNYRVVLKRRYKIKSYEANQLWVHIKQRFLECYYSEAMKETASGIHLLYITSVLAILPIPFAILAGNLCKAAIFFGIFLVGFVGAFLLDKSYEDIERGYLSHIDEKDLDNFVQGILRNKQERKNS